MSALIGFFTGGWGLVLGIWKRIAPYLTVRNLLILAGILAFAYAQYKFYNWAEDNIIRERVFVAADKQLGIELHPNTLPGAPGDAGPMSN